MLKTKNEESFLKDLKKVSNNIKIRKLLEEVFFNLKNNINLETRYCNHKLKGKLSGYYDCHLLPDLILIYKISDNNLILKRLCKHSEL